MYLSRPFLLGLFLLLYVLVIHRIQGHAPYRLIVVDRATSSPLNCIKYLFISGFVSPDYAFHFLTTSQKLLTSGYFIYSMSVLSVLLHNTMPSTKYNLLQCVWRFLDTVFCCSMFCFPPHANLSNLILTFISVSQ